MGEYSKEPAPTDIVAATYENCASWLDSAPAYWTPAECAAALRRLQNNDLPIERLQPSEETKRAVNAEAERDALQERLDSLPKGFREWNAQIDAIEAKTIERCANWLTHAPSSWGPYECASSLLSLKGDLKSFLSLKIS